MSFVPEGRKKRVSSAKAENMKPFDKIHFNTHDEGYVYRVLELVQVERFIPASRGWVGAPPKDREALARAFVAKAVLNLPTTEGLIDRLKVDHALRRVRFRQSLPDSGGVAVLAGLRRVCRRAVAGPGA